MSANPSGLRLEALARKWHELAERRVAHYNELYRSGRWQHYYRSQEQFALRMLDVIAVAKVFRSLTGKPPAAAAPRDDIRPAA
jgi:hypothetical protein